MKSIFISSTYEDLINERKKVIETIDRLDSTEAIAINEKIPSNPNPSPEVCLSYLQKSDLVILILGSKYGSEDPKENISITELEYNEAKKLEIPVLVFIKTDDNGTWIADKEDVNKKNKLEKFKKKLDFERTRVKFKTPDELCYEITTALYNFESENGEIGIKNPQFLTGESFFKPFLEKNHLFNYCQTFFGRIKIIEELFSFVESEKNVLILFGRGGIGKTKLLYEFYKQLSEEEGCKIWFLRDNAQFSKDSFKQLPLKKKNLIIIDDVHRQNSLFELLKIAIEKPESIQLIFSTRNYGLEYIKNLIFQSGFDPSDIEILPEITNLKRKDLIALADSILDNNHKYFTNPLVSVAKDSPLVLVIEAKLINENSIDPALLSNNENFKNIVFSRFQDIQIGDISRIFDKTDIKKILSLLSAIQPIDLIKLDVRQSELSEKISEFTKIELEQVISIISELESAGVLLKRRYGGLRITPDTFSDYLLKEACVTKNGYITGYSDKVIDTFYNLSFKEIITNFAELDWRIQACGNSIDLMNNIWTKIFQDFELGPNLFRHHILISIEKIANIQPRKSLELVEFTLNNPSTDNVNYSGLKEYTHEDVKDKIPKILQNISYNLKYLPKCCDLLWELGKNKEGILHSDLNHPIRILQDIAEYGYSKPKEVQEIILDSVEKWIKDPSKYYTLHSPLDVIDPILKKDGDDHWLKGNTIEITSFMISYQKTKLIRKRALDIISLASTQKSTKISLRAIQSLAEMLRPPRPIHGRKISQEELSQWIPEEKEILDLFEKIVNGTKDPIVKIKIRQELKTYARDCKDEDNQRHARKIIKKIRDNFDIRLMKALLFSFDDDYRFDYEKRIKDTDTKIEKTIHDFISKNQSYDKIYSTLNRLIYNLENEQIYHQPGRFFYLLGKLYPKKSGMMCQKIISDNSSALDKYYGTILSGIIQSDTKLAGQFIKKGIQSNRLLICRSIAFGYSNGWLQGGIKKGELSIIEKMLNSSDGLIKEYAISSLSKFPESKNRMIKTIALNLEIEDNISYADAFLELFTPPKSKKSITFTKPEITKILKKLVILPLLTRNYNSRGYYICNFLNYASEKNPEAMLSFFLERIMHAQEINDNSWNRYEPIPFPENFHCIENFYKHSEYKNLLKKFLYEAYNAKGNKYNYVQLFEILSNNYSEDALQVLKNWPDYKNQDEILFCCDLLKEASPKFLIEYPDIIHIILESSLKINEALLDNVKRKLFAIAKFSPRFGSVGEPYPIDIELKNGAEDCVNNFSEGSVTNQFYNELAKMAVGWMEESILDDEDLID
ncbi:DUF4062 domain-containing protein [Methanoplanus limicola]|uniref:DUF4062 domain-containing protein n=1 Tax=Methanoplanus limicola DSM 2279 TaxID=937775 RepID=H1Z2I4_9EURY|nr:DUF4062 domain-containing protein [Methanoplanus limicola]EHQ35510.1 hypothetical protein Metlim_1404 [Methanoplanus limicola DSM 2279]